MVIDRFMLVFIFHVYRCHRSMLTASNYLFSDFLYYVVVYRKITEIIKLDYSDAN